MPPNGATITVTLGFMPASHAMPDVDHPGLLRAGPRAGAPYGGEHVERHSCPATDLAQGTTTRSDLLELGFDTVDLSPFEELQGTFARVADAGRITEADAATIRAALKGLTLRCAGGATLQVLHIADEGLIMRSAGPNGLSVVAPQPTGMNDHGAATSVHADQDVYGTPLAQLMDGRAPSLLRHDSPDGPNHDAGLMLVNLWVPLHQITQPLVLGDGRSIDRRRHQLRYGLPTTAFLERDDDMVINDIWKFLHDPGQRWYLRSELDHRSAYVFDTLSTAHTAGTLPGEETAERCYRALEDAEAAVLARDAAALAGAVAPARHPDVPTDTPPALRAAIAAMVAVADEAGDAPAAVCGERAEAWLTASRAARRAVIRMS
ncbi:MAG: hypothetical protein FJW95_11930, partial [Actinobacteria bacterium]|nr:hypothetical protein [Actinomycetota bacterium]